VIVTDIAELKFVETHGFGLRFPVGDASGLREALAVVLKDGDMRSRLGRLGRAYAKNCLWDSVAREFERTLESVVDEKH
jgi:glycosyltransferase involved in cell wall biosynthesis